MLRGCAVIVSVCAFCLSGLAVRAADVDSDLKTGIRKAQEGEFDVAIKTLESVVKQLTASGGRPQDLSRAYVYLSVAYLGLAQEQAARAKFIEAWRADRDLKLTSTEFPPRVLRFLEEAREEARQAEASARQAGRAPESVARGSAQPVPVPTPAPRVEVAAGSDASRRWLGIGAGYGLPARGWLDKSALVFEASARIPLGRALTLGALASRWSVTKDWPLIYQTHTRTDRDTMVGLALLVAVPKGRVHLSAGLGCGLHFLTDEWVFSPDPLDYSGSEDRTMAMILLLGGVDIDLGSRTRGYLSLRYDYSKERRFFATTAGLRFAP